MSSRDMRGSTTQRKLSSRQATENLGPKSKSRSSNRASSRQTAPIDNYSDDDAGQDIAPSRKPKRRATNGSTTRSWKAKVHREITPGPISIETIHFRPDLNFADPLWLYPKTLILTVFMAALMMGLLGRKYITPHFSLVWLLPGAPNTPENMPNFEASKWAAAEAAAAADDSTTTPNPIVIIEEIFDKPLTVTQPGYAPGAGFDIPTITGLASTKTLTDAGTFEFDEDQYFRFSDDDELPITFSTPKTTAMTTREWAADKAKANAKEQAEAPPPVEGRRMRKVGW